MSQKQLFLFLLHILSTQLLSVFLNAPEKWAPTGYKFILEFLFRRACVFRLDSTIADVYGQTKRFV